MIDEYYGLRGWDLSTGWPTPEKLRELSLEKEIKSFYPGQEEREDSLVRKS